jgi:hypothetical protein
VQRRLLGVGIPRLLAKFPPVDTQGRCAAPNRANRPPRSHHTGIWPANRLISGLRAFARAFDLASVSVLGNLARLGAAACVRPT